MPLSVYTVCVCVIYCQPLTSVHPPLSHSAALTTFPSPNKAKTKTHCFSLQLYFRGYHFSRTWLFSLQRIFFIMSQITALYCFDLFPPLLLQEDVRNVSGKWHLGCASMVNTAVWLFVYVSRPTGMVFFFL